VQKRVDILGMFLSVQHIEHNENNAKAVSTVGDFSAGVVRPSALTNP
jgi:hypothetical protein